ncbi:ParA family protein [Pseudoneobacillus sp. C159]
MAISITFGNQKGGCGKSTTTGILAHLLSNEGYRTLVIDMDSQGNITELLSGKISNEFVGKSVLEAMQENDIEKFVYPIKENLELLPANNFLATFSRWIYTGKTYLGEHKPLSLKNPSLVLNKALESVRDKYDFILIDTPPSLSEQTTNALCSSDFVILMFDCSSWCYSCIPNFMDSVKAAKKVGNRNVEVIGILRFMSDVKRKDAIAFQQLIEEDYPQVVFGTVIHRRASIGRISLFGFNNNQELNHALSHFQGFYEELLHRVKKQY